MLTIRLDGYPEMINISDEVSLSKYYENYCREGFLAAMWNSPNLLGFEKNDCLSPVSRELVLLKDTDREAPEEYRALFASLQNRGEDSARILRGILDRHLKGSGKNFWEHNGDFLRKILDSLAASIVRPPPRSLRSVSPQYPPPEGICRRASRS